MFHFVWCSSLSPPQLASMYIVSSCSRRTRNDSGCIPLGKYQEVPPQKDLLGGPSWGGTSWVHQSSESPTSIILYALFLLSRIVLSPQGIVNSVKFQSKLSEVQGAVLILLIMLSFNVKTNTANISFSFCFFDASMCLCHESLSS